VKARIWTEHREMNVINTGHDLLPTRKGDLVMAVVIERWDDLDAAIDQLRKLVRPSGEP